jgi:hypothetical protein
MKALHSIPFVAVVLVAALSAPALADPAPAPTQQGQIMAGPGDGAEGPINQVNQPSGFSLSSSTPGSTVVAPQASTPQPVDSASGLATGRRTYEPVASTTQTDGQNTSSVAKPDHEIEYDLVRKRADHEGEIDCVTNCAGGTGAGGSAPTGYLKIEGVDGESVVQPSGNTSTTRKKPRRNRTGTRGKRMHKP